MDANQLSSNECEACDIECLTCTQGECLTCVSGYLLLTDGTCVKGPDCPNNYLKDNDRCLRCHPSCEGCTGTTSNCLACAAGYLQNHDTTCVQTCPDEYYPQNGRCEYCGYSCKTCSISAVGSCTSCMAPKEPSSNQATFHCLNPCDPGEFRQGLTCATCDPSCLECTDSTPNSCTNCNLAGNSPILHQGSCIAACPQGYIENTNTSPKSCE